MSKDWFDKYHKDKITVEFEQWWLEYYGPPGDYLSNENEQGEYWLRKGFALIGWYHRDKE